MSHYILIHGAWEESRMWGNVSPILEQSGHTVTAIDLPGHGQNKRPISQVTMENYIQTVVGGINRLNYNVILVGHSMAGAIISQVAERIPEKIEKLIYVSAFLLKEGGSILEAMQGDPNSELFPKIVFSEDKSYATVPEQVLRSIGLNDVEEKVIQRILPLMAEQQATEPFMAKVVVSNKNFGSVPKIYIRTTIDKVISPALQDAMTTNWKVEAIYDLESGHFPAFSVPEKLAGLML